MKKNEPDNGHAGYDDKKNADAFGSPYGLPDIPEMRELEKIAVRMFEEHKEAFEKLAK